MNYNKLHKINRAFTGIAALLLLLGFAITPVGDLLGLGSSSGLMIFVSILAGSVLIERKLDKLMIAQAFEESLGVDLEKASDELFQAEKERRRKEGKH